ncbi:MAG: gliding motility protein GldL [Bacteroidota bacterium]|nr:gliding motility protein GldL [Bacteroidota bacterium]
MGLAEMTQGHKWKVFMKYIYGWGAAVVIVGALFKITHWPGATVLLTTGLLTEAIIFFFSAFEPLHEEVDWTLVYPELAGIGDMDIEKTATKKSVSQSDNTGIEAMDKLGKMLDDAGEKNLFEKFGQGIENLSGKVDQLSDISDASLATNEYSESMKNASNTVNSFNEDYKQSTDEVGKSVNELAGTYKQSAEAVNYASDGLNDSFSKVSQTVASSGENFEAAYKQLIDEVGKSVNELAGTYKQSAEAVNYASDGLNDSFSKVSQTVASSGENFEAAYKQLTDSMDLDFSSLQAGNSEYNSRIGNLNKNLSALNAIFELQLNETDLDKMMSDLQGSVEHSAKYYAEVTKLGKRLESLNSVYGNILSAMNVNVS